MPSTLDGHRKAIIGSVDSTFWLYDSQTGFDLTHPSTPTTPTVDNAIRIKTTTMPIAIDPVKSAIVIIDMQNFFLSTALGRPSDSKGLRAQKQLLQYAIPAARKAGIRIVWLNWGLTDEDICRLPPSIVRTFGFETVEASQSESHIKRKVSDGSRFRMSSDVPADSPSVQIESFGKSPKRYLGAGNDMGQITLDDGSVVEAGRLLVRDQWNAALTPELSRAYEEGQKAKPADVWIHKNRMSGLWGISTPCTEFLDKEGIKTLFFAGVNTDQCVGGSMTDAFSRGYDCVLLGDGAATSSPAACQESYEFNAAGTFGFCTSCKDLWDGVEARTK